MTVKLLKHQTNRKYSAYSADTKPILGPEDTGAELYEIDTKKIYTWFFDDWEYTSSPSVSIKGPELTTETDTVRILEDISNKLSTLIDYEILLHKIDLTENT